MRITLDRSINAAYISFSASPREGQVVKTYPCDPLEIGGEINLDFDSNGRLIGIEVMDAARFLPSDLLIQAEIIGEG
jgi:uncharacterized protein YuzE